MWCKSHHAFPKFASTMQRVQVGNEQYVAVLFVIPVIIDICRHRFEVFTLASELHDNVDLMLGMKNVCELKGVLDMWDSSFKFLNRSIPFFKGTGGIETKRKEIHKDRSSFVDGI